MSILNKKRAKRLKSGDRDYVSNKDLCIALTQYIKDLKEFKVKNETGKLDPPDYVVKSIMLICQRRLNSFNFSDYDFKDEMYADALLDCFKYIDRFDINVSDNPFSYFTTIASNAYIRRIKAEKKELYIKYALIDETIIFEDDATQIQKYGDDSEEIAKNEFMRKYEKSQKEVKEKAKQKKLEKMLSSKKSLIKEYH